MASRAPKLWGGERAGGPAAAEQRAAPRVRVAIRRATVRGHGRESEPAVLHDVSIYGCRLTTDMDLVVGERLWLRLDGSMPLAATTIWAEDAMIGCRFDEPMDRHILRSLTLGLHAILDAPR